MGKTYTHQKMDVEEKQHQKKASHHGHAKYKRGRKVTVNASTKIKEADLVKMDPRDLLTIEDFDIGLDYDD